MLIITTTPNRSSARGLFSMWADPLAFPWDVPDPAAPDAVAGALGVNVAEGFETHEVATAAADTLDGAWLLIVAFPEKSQDCAFRLVAS